MLKEISIYDELRLKYNLLYDMPCEFAFKEILRQDPKDLIKLLPELQPYDLTYAAEVLGNGDTWTDEMESILINLLFHASDVVKEGALYGLYDHKNTRVNQTVQHLSNITMSKAIKEVTQDFLRAN